MPFRTNAFGDQIAQPGTIFSEIDTMFLDRYDRPPAIYGAYISSQGDDQFQFGGSLNDNGFEQDEDEDTAYVSDEPRTVEFDGFESVEAAREWVLSLGEINARDITVD